MPGVIEAVELVDTWLWSTLSGDAELTDLVGDRIIGTLGEVTGYPYVQFDMASTRDVTVVGGERIDTDSLWLVKAVAETGSWDDVLPVAQRIVELLDRPHETIDVPGGSLTSIREIVIRFPEMVEGAQYRHLGANFRIRASAIP